MNPVLKATLLSWEWRPEVIAVLAIAGATYGLGWRRLRQSGHYRLANGYRLAFYLSGLFVLAIALLSFIDLFQSLLFTMHMVQHLLLMMVVPPLIHLANPFPFILWGLPVALRQLAGRAFSEQSRFRRALRRLTRPWLSWVFYVAAIWGWHVPSAYELALRNQLIHDLEHLSFFGAAMLFWWHVARSAPHIHGRIGHGFRIVYVIIALVQNEILSVIITLSGQPLYAYYTTVPRIWGLSVMDDQASAGTIMWVPGGMMYVLTVIILLARLMDYEEKKAKRMENCRLHSV